MKEKDLIFSGQNEDEPTAFGFINEEQKKAYIEISGRFLCEQYSLRDFHVKMTSWILNYIYDSSFWLNTTDLTITFDVEYIEDRDLITIGLIFQHLEILINAWAKFREIKIRILWVYPNDDDDLKETAEMFKVTHNLDFELLAK